MTTRRISIGLVALAASIGSVGSPGSATAQSLDARIRSASSARVQFEFPGKADVCGDGQSFHSTGTGSPYYGRVNVVDGVATQQCANGPVRVVIDRADGVVTNIQTVAGPLHTADGAADLGAVSGRDAADYLMSIAAHTDGRANRQAILPAAIADGVDASPILTSLAVDQNRPLDTRRSALSWLARDDGAASSAQNAKVTELLLRIARDENETQALRRALDISARSTTGGSQALALYDTMDDLALKESLIRIYAQNNDRASVDKLISIAKTDSNFTLRRRAIASLSRTQDPRVRQALQDITTR